MSDQPKFTPGPWDSHGEDEITTGFYEAHVATAWNNDRISPDEATANARLIAAAPDLLAACIATHKDGRTVMPIEVWDVIRGAIEKATGTDLITALTEADKCSS